jgi:hypothetical protein
MQLYAFLKYTAYVSTRSNQVPGGAAGEPKHTLEKHSNNHHCIDQQEATQHTQPATPNKIKHAKFNSRVATPSNGYAPLKYTALVSTRSKAVLGGTAGETKSTQQAKPNNH